MHLFCEGRCNLDKARYALFDSDHPSPKSARSLKNELVMKIIKHSRSVKTHLFSTAAKQEVIPPRKCLFTQHFDEHYSV